MALKWINQRNVPIIHFPGCKTRAVGIYFLLSSVISGWKINGGIWFMFFPVVPHWRTEGALWEPGGDRRHSHAAGFPAPAFDGDTPPGGETQVQHRAGKQELAYTRSTCQAQLHRLARRSDLNVYHCLLNWRQKQKRCCWLDKPSCQPFSGEEFEGVLYVYIIWKAPPQYSYRPLLYRCYLRGAAGHPGQQVGVTGLLQPDRPHPRLVLLELPSSRVSLRSRKDPSSTHEESLLHREVECAVASFKQRLLLYLTEQFSNLKRNILLTCELRRQP